MPQLKAFLKHNNQKKKNLLLFSFVIHRNFCPIFRYILLRSEFLSRMLLFLLYTTLLVQTCMAKPLVGKGTPFYYLSKGTSLSNLSFCRKAKKNNIIIHIFVCFLGDWLSLKKKNCPSQNSSNCT